METIIDINARSLQYYVIAKRWASDLEFFKIETGFFKRLLDDQFSRLSTQVSFDKLKQVSKKLSKLEMDESRTDTAITRQIKQIELMTEDVIPEDMDNLTMVQVQLETIMANLTTEYREIKIELFEIVCLTKVNY
jgi:hypothetical protein